MTMQLKVLYALVALVIAIVGFLLTRPDPNKVADASGVTPEQRAAASAAFRGGEHFARPKPGKYEWAPPEGATTAPPQK